VADAFTPVAGGAVWFDAFRFDVAGGRLWRGEDEVPLRPKAAAVLGCLVAHAGELVSKRELLETVWPEGFVGDAALTVCVNELRQTFGDNPRQPRFIATAHRRGYRFIAAALSQRPAAAGRAERALPFVGRAAELELLEGWWKLASAGERQVVFVAAQAGVGKSALVDVFVDRVRASPQALIGRGQCVEQFGGSEPYLPVLDALYGLGRGPAGGHVRGVLRSVAPAWLLQLPGLNDPADLDKLRVRTLGASSERMLREIGDALTALSARRPLVLVCEDAHVSDRSTTELLAYLARRREPARLLVLCTYRPAEVAVQAHPLRHVVQDLRGRGRCRYLALELLGHQAIAEFLAQRLAPRRQADALVDEIYGRTNGNALFLTTLADYLIDHDLLVESVDGLRALRPLGHLGVPETMVEFIEHQLSELVPLDRSLVEVAAAVGVDFTVDAVLAGARHERPNLTAAEVEDRFAGLTRDVGLLTEVELAEWPDGTITGRYRFHHALYQEVLYHAMAPARRVAIHRRVGERLAAAYGDRADEIAVELAMHAERGHDLPQAVRHLAAAGETALRRAAHREALDDATRGLEVLERTDAVGDRAAVELRLRMTHTVALAALQGAGSPGVDVAYLRARAVCDEIDDPSLLAPVLYGLWNFAVNQRSVSGASEFSDELAELARRHPDQVISLQAAYTAGFNDWVGGRPSSAMAHFARCLDFYDPGEHRHLALTYGEDPAVGSHRSAAAASWVLGYPDRARDHAREGCRLADRLGYPNDIANATSFACGVHVMCRDVERAGELSETLLWVADRHDLALFSSVGRIYNGWVLAHLGEAERGVAQMRDGLAEFGASVSEGGLHFLTSLLVEALVQLGDLETALKTAIDALELARRAGQRWYESEHIRQRGELLLAEAAPSVGRSSADDAQQAFLEAHAIARWQQARSLELRAATSLARLWQGGDEAARGTTLLAETYGCFSEGYDTGDLRAAAAILAELG
jgi:DNA-binding winged helix-turn-helix (wHTH) protein/predicted ATPase